MIVSGNSFLKKFAAAVAVGSQMSTCESSSPAAVTCTDCAPAPPAVRGHSRSPDQCPRPPHALQVELALRSAMLFAGALLLPLPLPLGLVLTAGCSPGRSRWRASRTVSNASAASAKRAVASSSALIWSVPMLSASAPYCSMSAARASSSPRSAPERSNCSGSSASGSS